MHLKRQRGNVPLWIGVALVLLLSYVTYSQKSGLIEANFEQKLQTLDLGYSSPPSIKRLLSDLPDILTNKIKGYPDRPPLDRIDIDIPLVEYKKILQDRERGLANNNLFNPEDVKAKVRYRGKVIKAKVRLKGDLPDHWTSQYRMSFRVSLKGNNSVMGYKKFSLHKPASRQHPFDQAFSDFLKASGNIGSSHGYIQVFVNGMDWGVMNIEEHMSKELLEKQKRKESLITRFGSEDKGVLYRNLVDEDKYKMYRLGEPRLYLKVYDENNYIRDPLQRKRATYIVQQRVKNDHVYLYDVESYARTLIAATIWNDAHPLYYSNSRHYFNPYTLKLEPIASDSVGPIPYAMAGRFPRRKLDPILNSYLYRQVVSSQEYVDALDQQLRQVINSIPSVQGYIDNYQSFFPLDKKISVAGFLEENAKFVYQFKDDVLVPEVADSPADEPFQVVHRENGVLEFYNRMPERVVIEKLFLDGKKLADLKGVLPPFDQNINEPVIIKTKLAGDMTGRISIGGMFQGHEYTVNVEPTISVLASYYPAEPLFERSNVKPSERHADLFAEHLQVRHFKDGRFEIYNLINASVELEEISLDGKVIKSDLVTIPGFKGTEFKPVIIQTDLKGIFDGRISIKSSFMGRSRELRIPFTLDDEGAFNPLLAVNNSELPVFVEKIEGRRFGIPKGRWDVQKPLVIDGDLMLQAGAELRFSRDAYLIVKGGVYAEGTEQEPIVLTANSDYWKGVYIVNAKLTSKLKHVRVEKTRGVEDGLLALTGGVTFYRSNVVMEDVQFGPSEAEDALNIVESEFKLTNVYVAGSRSDGIDFDFSQGEILGSAFVDVGGDALDFSGSKVKIANVKIDRVHDKAVSVGEGTEVDLRSVFIDDVGVGVASKDGSVVVGDGVVINGYHLRGIMSYMKKSFYDEPSVNLANVSLSQAGNALSRQEGTEMYINGVEVPEESLDVERLYKSETMAK